LTSLLFTAGKSLLGLYLGRNSTVTTYGTAGSLVLILLWVYYSAQILFLGAEFTRVFATRYGVCPQPKSHARWIVPKSKAFQNPEPEGQTGSSLKRPLDTKTVLLAQLRQQVESMRAADRANRYRYAK